MDVDPRQIETVLMRHTGIGEASVIVVADEDGGKIIKAIVVPARGARLSEAEVLAFVAPQLSPDERPRSVEFVPQLPQD